MGGDVGGSALPSTNKFDEKGDGGLPMAHAAMMVALLFSMPRIVSLSPSLPPVALLSTVARHGLLSGAGHHELGVRSAAATVRGSWIDNEETESTTVTREIISMRSCRSSTISGVVRHLAWLVLVFSWQVAAAQAQQAPKTDPAEVAAMNTILGRWGKKASSEWNISGEPCSGYAVDKTDWDYYPNINPFIKCDCIDSNNTVCHITKLALAMNPLWTTSEGTWEPHQSCLLPRHFTGGLPEELGNLTKLRQLYIDSSGFSGPFPSAFWKLQNLKILRASDNGFIGRIPDYLGSTTNLQDIAFQGNSFEGPIPQSLSNQINKLNHLISRQAYSIMLNCALFRFLGNNSLTGMLPDDYSFAIDCGSKTALRGSDNTIYEADPTNLGDASYYVNDQTRWSVSSVGNYFQATDGNNIISSPQHFQNVVDSELFETERISPSSLRYYGHGLENGNYTVVLQFAEFPFPDSQTWLSLGRRVFDIYVQGALKEKDFDIRKTAGGKSFGAVNRSYVATGKLPNGRVIAVKQLSQSSHQGTNQFVTEAATISAVQHRNLVRLHGCCIDSKTPLLVYEYLENGSLDRAIFGQSRFNLD
uniref:non-specific serine/threonine protein kinase n=1 Tax=Oryza meridionalis TaxID=40149 RepID=A0A0E0DP18_9ORYZ